MRDFDTSVECTANRNKSNSQNIGIDLFSDGAHHSWQFVFCLFVSLCILCVEHIVTVTIHFAIFLASLCYFWLSRLHVVQAIIYQLNDIQCLITISIYFMNFFLSIFETLFLFVLLHLFIIFAFIAYISHTPFAVVVVFFHVEFPILLMFSTHKTSENDWICWFSFEKWCGEKVETQN